MSEISALASYVENWGGYDLHESDLGELQVDGWEGFPIRRFQYRKTDPGGTVKVGDVALLDPKPDQIAHWAHAAITEVLGVYSESKAFKLVDACGGASGFQFPVRGVHWEDMTSPFTAYTFFDGVTVRLSGWNPSWPTTVLSQNQLDSAIFASWDDVAEAMKYARIQSTTRAEYHNNGGLSATDGKEWLSVIRQCYQKAWSSESNELMTAKARSMFA